MRIAAGIGGLFAATLVAALAGASGEAEDPADRLAGPARPRSPALQAGSLPTGPGVAS